MTLGVKYLFFLTFYQQHQRTTAKIKNRMQEQLILENQEMQWQNFEGCRQVQTYLTIIN